MGIGVAPQDDKTISSVWNRLASFSGRPPPQEGKSKTSCSRKCLGEPLGLRCSQMHSNSAFLWGLRQIAPRVNIPPFLRHVILGDGTVRCQRKHDPCSLCNRAGIKTVKKETVWGPSHTEGFVPKNRNIFRRRSLCVLLVRRKRNPSILKTALEGILLLEAFSRRLWGPFSFCRTCSRISGE